MSRKDQEVQVDLDQEVLLDPGLEVQVVPGQEVLLDPGLQAVRLVSKANLSIR